MGLMINDKLAYLLFMYFNNRFVNLICLPGSVPAPVEGKKCWITGWGRNRPIGGSSPVTLQQASVPIVGRNRCEWASNWLTVIPIKEMNFNLNKREFRDAIKLRYDWEIADLPAMCTCGDLFTVDHAMVCRHGGADHSEAQ